MNYESEAEDKVKELFELSRLYDVYGGLLKDHSKQIFEDYVLNNYSLAEIAADVDLSRQGVRDIVVRCSKKLHEYEDCLGFLNKIDNTDAELSKLREIISSETPDKEAAIELIDSIRTELEV